MSSILKALQKLEHENSLGGRDKLWLKETRPALPGKDRFKGTWITHYGIYIVCGAALVLLGAGITLISSMHVSNTEPVRVTASEGVSENEMPIPRRPETPGEFGQKLSDPVPSTARRQASGRDAASVEPEATHKAPVRIAEASAEISKEPSSLDVVAPPASESLQSRPDLVETVPEQAPEQNVLDLNPAGGSENDQRLETPVLDDSGIKLQAISWSEIPQRRIAVINNRVVRQGNRIGIYSVVQINPDDVVVESGREMWKILFKPR